MILWVWTVTIIIFFFLILINIYWWKAEKQFLWRLQHKNTLHATHLQNVRLLHPGYLHFDLDFWIPLRYSGRCFVLFHFLFLPFGIKFINGKSSSELLMSSASPSKVPSPPSSSFSTSVSSWMVPKSSVSVGLFHSSHSSSSLEIFPSKSDSSKFILSAASWSSASVSAWKNKNNILKYCIVWDP